MEADTAADTFGGESVTGPGPKTKIGNGRRIRGFGGEGVNVDTITSRKSQDPAAIQDDFLAVGKIHAVKGSFVGGFIVAKNEGLLVDFQNSVELADPHGALVVLGIAGKKPGNVVHFRAGATDPELGTGHEEERRDGRVGGKRSESEGLAALGKTDEVAGNDRIDLALAFESLPGADAESVVEIERNRNKLFGKFEIKEIVEVANGSRGNEVVDADISSLRAETDIGSFPAVALDIADADLNILAGFLIDAKRTGAAKGFLLSVGLELDFTG